MGIRMSWNSPQRRKAMSKTIRKAKPLGFDYWTRRPGNSGGSPPGRVTKNLTHRAERRQTRKAEYLASNAQFDAVEVVSPFRQL